jgi:hypothetical protein
MTSDERADMLSALTCLVPRCSTCGHDVSLGRHLGMSAMDMHHEPTTGPAPIGFGRVVEWWHERPYSSRAVVVDYIGPDGERRPVRLYPNGRREPIAAYAASQERTA